MQDKGQDLGAPAAPKPALLASLPEPASGLRPAGDDPARGGLFGDEPAWLPCITLWQPWASLIFTGNKPDETRGFRYPAKHEGQTIAIHSAASFPALRHISEELHEVCLDVFGCGYNFSLPRGVILGTTRLSGCHPADLIAGFRDPNELACGDYSVGRFAWLLSEVRALALPIPAKGKQGWWKVRADVVAALRDSGSGSQSEDAPKSAAEAEGPQSGPNEDSGIAQTTVPKDRP